MLNVKQTWRMTGVCLARVFRRPYTPGMSDYERQIKAGRIVPGMSFNEKVWALTARIPAGKVTTYRHLAEALKSKGYRAVGNALNRNPYAPAVPCHRVVGSNGALTGFAGGLAKKQQLLEAEGVSLRNRRADVSEAFEFALADR
jgi:methylated-DNA-[protein]-cysteine S-methyltransferase